VIVIIGDLINSRKLKNRLSAQERLKDSLSEVNKKYSDEIGSKFMITLGDEFQGLLLTGCNCLRILDEISFRMSPIEIRFGLGVGELNTVLNKELCTGMDGPVFWKAREAIQVIHKKNDYGRTNVHLCSQKNDFSVVLINDILKLTALQMSGWRDTQKEIYRLVLEDGIILPDKINHQRMSSRLGILNSSLSRRFESSGIKRYMTARLNAETAIEILNKSL
jgi:hypothetical protein